MRERELLVKAVARIDELTELYKAAELNNQAIRVAMAQVENGDIAPFNSYEELEETAKEVAAKSPEIVKQAMEILQRKKPRSLGKVSDEFAEEPQQEEKPKALNRLMANLENINIGG